MPAAADPAGARAAGDRAARILVVDDDPLSRSLQAHLVSLLGHRAAAIDQPAQALELALSGGFDAMLLDLGMPELDGFTLLGRLRADEARRGRRPLPVIAVTGYAASIDRLRCLMAGFNEHLSKPVDVATLGAALDRHLPQPGPAVASDAHRVQQTARRLSEDQPADAGMGPTTLEAFALRSQQLIEQMQQALRRREGAALAQAAGALRASAEFMGATGLAELCQRAQAEAQAARFEAVAPLLERVAAEHATVLAVLLAGARPGAPR